MYFVINSVKFGQDDVVDEAGVCYVGVVSQGLVEFSQLINSFVFNQRFFYK